MLEQIILLPLYVIFGLFIGYFLTKIAPEELTSGIPYFLKVKALVFLLLSLTLLFMGLTTVTVPLFFVAFLGILLAMYTSTPPYLLFAIILAFTANATAVVIASLMFVYGMLHVSLFHKKPQLHSIIFVFAVPYALIFLLTIHTFINGNYPLALGAGFALAYAYKLTCACSVHDLS